MSARDIGEGILLLCAIAFVIGGLFDYVGLYDLGWGPR